MILINGRAAANQVPKLGALPLEASADEMASIANAAVETEVSEGNLAVTIHGLRQLSVVIAARNEAPRIEPALRSLVGQSHPNYEIIIVNDRSTDDTGAIIDRLANMFPNKIQALHVTELPEGWLGKCNALQQGAEAATGDYILFTDADVEFESTVLERAHRYANREDADQFAVIPETQAGTYWEKTMLNVFGLCFILNFPPHRVMQRNSGRFIGIGAFNMIKTSMYNKIHKHKFLRLQVVDDLGLGKLVKYSGGNIRIAWGLGYVKVRWQESLAATIRGLEKNFFASTNYSLIKSTAMVVGVFILFIWPWVGIWFGPTGARAIAGLALVMQIIVAAMAAIRAGFCPLHGFTAQFGALCIIAAMIRSTWVTLRRGGIVWRDSFYPLKDLRQFRL